MTKFFGDSKINMMSPEGIDSTVDPEVEMEEEDFRSKLEDLINHHSMENGSNTPDFLLAEYLYNCLLNFDRIVNMREGWYGRQSESPFTGEEDINTIVDKLED